MFQKACEVDMWDYLSDSGYLVSRYGPAGNGLSIIHRLENFIQGISAWSYLKGKKLQLFNPYASDSKNLIFKFVSISSNEEIWKMKRWRKRNLDIFYRFAENISTCSIPYCTDTLFYPVLYAVSFNIVIGGYRLQTIISHSLISPH